jgi:mono/diheme cytochrome c family protein
MWRYSALALLLVLAGCERYPTGGELRLHNDMVEQPTFRPQRDPLPLPDGAIPVNGYEAPITLEAAMATLKNPLAPTPANLAIGQQLFNINCRHCHGGKAHGDGPVAAKMPQPANLTLAKYVQSPDGLFYYRMRYGGVIMPPLAEALSPADRWHIVLYIRKLQQP